MFLTLLKLLGGLDRSPYRYPLLSDTCFVSFFHDISGLSVYPDRHVEIFHFYLSKIMKNETDQDGNVVRLQVSLWDVCFEKK